MDDELALVAAALGGDTEAWQHLIVGYDDIIAGAGYRRGLAHPELDQLRQKVWIALIEVGAEGVGPDLCEWLGSVAAEGAALLSAGRRMALL